MNTKTIFTGAIVLLVIGGLFFWGRVNQVASSETPSGRASALAAAETFYDFGTISMARGTVDKVFEITNPTDKDITLASLTTSCMCTTAFIVNGGTRRGPFGMPGHGAMPRVNETLVPGEYADVEVVFDPAAHGPAGIGTVERTVFLEYGGGKELTLGFKVLVTP